MAEPLAFACALNPDDLDARCEELLPGLVASALDREEIDGGYRYRFGAESLTAVFHAIDEERQCCPFFRFEVVIEAEAAGVILSVTGPEGVREFIDGLTSVR